MGERYAVTCRRVLVDLLEAEAVAGGEQAAPRGTLTITAPPILGDEVLRPFIDAYLEAFPAVAVHLLLLTRGANLIEGSIWRCESANCRVLHGRGRHRRRREARDDVIDAVVFLESAGIVTGEILHVDGGQSAGH